MTNADVRIVIATGTSVFKFQPIAAGGDTGKGRAVASGLAKGIYPLIVGYTCNVAIGNIADAAVIIMTGGVGDHRITYAHCGPRLIYQHIETRRIGASARRILEDHFIFPRARSGKIQLIRNDCTRFIFPVDLDPGAVRKRHALYGSIELSAAGLLDDKTGTIQCDLCIRKIVSGIVAPAAFPEPGIDKIDAGSGILQIKGPGIDGVHPYAIPQRHVVPFYIVSSLDHQATDIAVILSAGGLLDHIG